MNLVNPDSLVQVKIMIKNGKFEQWMVNPRIEDVGEYVNEPKGIEITNQ